MFVLACVCVRVCVYACGRERIVDRDQNREHERAQIGHGWSVRSPFQTTPRPSTLLQFYLLSSLLSFAYRLLFYIYVFLWRIVDRYRSVFVPVHPMSIDLSSSSTHTPYATLSLRSSFCRSSHLSINLACSSTRAPFQNY